MPAGAKALPRKKVLLIHMRQKELIDLNVLGRNRGEGRGNVGERGKGNKWCDVTFL